MTKLLDLILQ